MKAEVVVIFTPSSISPAQSAARDKQLRILGLLQADPDMQAERESYPSHEIQVDSRIKEGPIGAMVG